MIDGIPELHALADLTGRVAVVTGAGSGIGRAAAVRLAEAGADVCCLDVDGAAADDTASMLASAGSDARAVQVDVREGKQVAAAIATCVEWHGRLDVVVNAAGIFPPVELLEMADGEWDHVLDVNAKGTFLVAQAAARHIGTTGTGGAIVNVASKSAYQPTSGFGHYAASKGAVVQLTKALALELAPLGIRVNAVAPGAVATPGAARAGRSLPSTPAAQSKAADFATRCPMGRPAQADEVARVILFLATPWSSYVTGETVLVDGGFLLS